jgi:hypothetical protein
MPISIANRIDSGGTTSLSAQSARAMCISTIILQTDRQQFICEARKGHTDELLREQHPERDCAPWCEAFCRASIRATKIVASKSYKITCRSPKVAGELTNDLKRAREIGG